ncbi:Alpha/Beta hydrolase protein [Aspergillus pseudoustus]|uniref:Alpha/Beta hydrolase protein n=1 Tax=Aspergillus pseudoustus TaxID=1810923 RepID=A0ABR4KFP0_9EURO
MSPFGMFRFVFLDPTTIAHPESAYTGVLTIDPTIRPCPIAGFWYESAPPADKIPELIVIHFHGGAFVTGSARPSEAGWGGDALSKRLQCPVLMPQYRLSDTRDRATTFPAALQDAVTAYSYVLYTLKVKPENIILSGDSAGGNLVLALLRHLKDIHERDGAEDENTLGQELLPFPRTALLWGPWVNLDTPAIELDRHRNASTDFIFGDFGKWGVRAYLPDRLDSSEYDEEQLYSYISPLGREFRTHVPIFIQTGTAEVLYDSHCQLARNLEDVGCRVEFVEIPYALHDTFILAEVTGLEEEMRCDGPSRRETDEYK